MATQKLKLTRDQLATFLKDHEQIKQFERLFEAVDTIAPDVVSEIQTEAGNASAKANDALAQLSRIADALESIASNPVVQHDNSVVTDCVDLSKQSWKPAYLEGRLFYDTADHSLAYYNDAADITVNIAREQLVRVYNATGSVLLNGKMVYINGASSGWPTVTLAQANGSVVSQSTLGMVTADIPTGEYGYVCVEGVVNGLDTSPYSPGTRLYLSATSPGDWTSVPPLQPNYVVEIAVVVAQDASIGRLFVRVDKRDWFPNIEIRDTSAAIVLPTTPTVFKPSTIVSNDGFMYDPSTGILTINNSGSFAISIQFNAEPSASNKNIYFYAEDSTDGGSTWTITRYSGRQLELENAVETQVTVNAARYYATGTKLRFYIWGDATVTLRTTDLPGTTPGTVTKPAYRFLMA